ncbi:biotin/lipoyl-containing protein [Nocardioides yefusunii]|uniref:Biotin/lipoyl-containing protein n=1 Tax=Nocardioides yefusunii TaxID=2500546 RepID=A0ABW1R0Y8_9ACTN|nr:biotin/lipoyl-containing protein [Nocardioides yefusunii]
MTSPTSPPSTDFAPFPRASVSAPFHGLATLLIEVGEPVQSGQVVAVLEAMKMEAPITAPRSGVVTEVAFDTSATVQGGDLLLVID